MQQFVNGRKLGAPHADRMPRLVVDGSKNAPNTTAELSPTDHGPRFADRGPGDSKASFRLAVIESRSLLRDCLAVFFASTRGATVQGYPSLDDMIPATVGKQHDLVIVGSTGVAHNVLLERLALLCKTVAPCPVIVMQDVCDFGLVTDVLKAGARGVVPTSLTALVAAEAISLVLAGGSFFPAESLVQPAARAAPAVKASCNGLTAREEQVLSLLKSGQQNKQIAYALGLSEGTVKVHLHNLMRKLGTTNRTQTILATP
jgi:DNA-binding NarL/FixJ family response regulator